MSRKEGSGSRRLIDHIAGAPELEPPTAVLATTFDLTPEFFEIDFLPSLLRLAVVDDARPRSRIQLEAALARMEAVAILMEGRRFHGRPRTLRVDVRPAMGAGSGVLHAKVTLIVHEHAVRLIVGSANLTAPGYRENREVVLAFHVDAKSREGTAVVREALQAMPTQLAPWWSEPAARVHALALETLERIGTPKDESGASFAWSGAERPLWQQVVAAWPRDEPVHTVRIVSPFWSEEEGDGPIARLLRALPLAKKSALHLVTSAQMETSTALRPLLPRSFGTFDLRQLGVATADAVAARAKVDDEDAGRDDVLRERRLHAKVLFLEGPTTTLAYVGSANFTVPGWGFGNASTANVEAGVVLVRSGRARASLLGLVPPVGCPPVALHGGAASTLAVAPTSDENVPFPWFVEAAELRPRDGDSAALELVVRINPARAPHAWGMCLTAGEDAPARVSVTGDAARGSEHTVALAPEELNALLRTQTVYFTWPELDGRAGVPYPVNVALSVRERLPFGDPEALPGENELVAFYQGSMSFEETFPVAAEEASGVETLGVEAVPVLVDTSRILSYQVRSFVEALRGIRDELRAATVARATMASALLGPVSPVALARHVRDAVRTEQRSPTAAAFQLVELLACIREVRAWDVDDRLVETWRGACTKAESEIALLLADVRRDSAALASGSPFDRYAQAVAPSQGGAR